MLNRRTKRWIAMCLSLSMAVGGTDITAFAGDSETKAEDTQVVSVLNNNTVQTDGAAWDGVTTQGNFEGNGFYLTFDLKDSWNGGFYANIKIENTGDTAIENWTLGFDYQGEIANVWNAVLDSPEVGKYIVKNAGWNQDIAVGESIEFGISGQGDFAGFPSEYHMLGQISTLDTDGYSFDYAVSNDWKSGFNAGITITNNEEKDLEDWILEFDYDRDITEIWNAAIESHEGNHYVVKNAEYNSVIPSKNSITFGFNGSNGNTDDIPCNYKIKAYQRGYTVKFDVGDGKIENIPSTQTIQQGQYAIEPQKPEKQSNYFMGWYLDKEYTQLFEFEHTPIEKNITLYALWFDPTSEIDTDNDGLTDEFEKVIGTDPRSGDTDGDGLSDCIEIEMLGTDPLMFDTDANGVSDGDEDFDGDGLSNKEECQYQTNICEKDTDGDGLTDYEEISIYFTNPLLADTDKDGLKDSSEIRLGTDPGNEDSDGNGIKDGEELFTQNVLQSNYQASLFEDNAAIPEISITSKGDVNEQVTVTEYTGHLKGDEREYVGKVIEIRDSKMESGELTFTIGKDYDSSTINGLLICYNDGENTTPLESMIDEERGSIRCDLTGDGIYFVVNVVEWLASYGIDVSTSMISSYAANDDDVNIATVKVKGQVDIVFVVDTTGSMTSYIRNVKNNIIAFVEELDSANIRSNFALVDYRDITHDGQHYTNVKKNEKDNSNWFKSAEEFKKQIEALSVSGGGDAPETAIDALEMARQLNMRKTSQKFFVLVTDAGYKEDNNYGITSMNEMIELLVADKINTSVVSNSRYQQSYKDLYTKTGGIFANVGGNFKNELLGIADNIKDNTNNGYWIALNGLLPQIVKLDEKPSPTSSADTDEDSILDNKELSSTIPTRRINVMDYFRLIHVPVEVRGKYIEVYDYNSNPAKEDTDGDGLLDGKPIYAYGKIVVPKDPEPKVFNGVEGIWKKQVEQHKNGTVATAYGDDYNWNIPELSEKIEGFPTNKYIADYIVEKLLEIRANVNYNETELRNVALFIKEYCNGEMATIAGAYLLNFVYDTDRQAYHSQPDTWQRNFGYNDFYDEVFRIGSYMKNLPITFSANDDQYRLWMWKGDYWNLHSGAEIGLYNSPTDCSGIDHYDAIDFEVPMTLNLYNYNTSSDIDTIFSWTPDPSQWWVTGFSGQNPEFLYPDENKMVVIGSIDLSAHQDIYDGLKKEKNNKDDSENERAVNQYLVFDDTTSTVWVCWYEGVK